jgi:hypothetical protein
LIIISNYLGGRFFEGPLRDLVELVRFPEIQLLIVIAAIFVILILVYLLQVYG